MAYEAESRWLPEDPSGEDGFNRPMVGVGGNGNAPTDRWWHYVGAVGAILGISALGFLGLRATESDCGRECSSIRQDAK